MKTYKKVSVWAGMVLFALASFLFLAFPHRAFADASGTDLGPSTDTFTALDSATIKAVLGQSGTFNFTDDNPYPQDSTFNFVPNKSGGDYVDGLCDPGDIPDQNGVSGKIKFGINLEPSPRNLTGLQANQLNANIKLGYTPNGSLACKGVLFKAKVDNPNGAAAASLEYSGTNIVNAPGFASQTYKPVSGAPNLYASDTASGSCGGGRIVLVSSSSVNSGTRYDLTSSKNASNGKDANSIAALKSFFPAGQCYLQADPQSVVIAGAPGSAAPGGSGGPGGAGTTADDGSCEANYNGPAHVFNWVFCGILEGMDSMFGTIQGQVEDQLNICTGKSSTTGETCGNNLLSNQVKKSWAVFRDIATALLVIIMLIMVFSQAISFGPFDAYTVRKMLPRIIAAVILMQISWPLFKFFVDLSNDLGKGVQDLMLAPFGGAKSVSFDNLIGQAGNFAPSLATAGLFTALLVGGIMGGLTIMGVALLGATAVLSVLVGLLVLLFRQMLIIMAMILAPIALVLWILPGTQKYWKLWSDNFLKLLLMFPLIMAMLAAGKIFAKIGVDTGTGIFAVIIVFVGFLGPLWFLPKTFRWGGQLFAAAANGTWGATKGFRGFPAKYASQQAKANREHRATDRNERISFGRARFGDRFLAAAGGVGLSSRGRELRRARGRAEGREAGEKAVAQEIVGSAYESQDHQAKLVTLDFLAQGQTDPTTGLNGSNPAMQRWALDQLATFGDWDRIDGLRASGNLDERVWQTFMAKNISAVHQNAPYLSPLRRDMSLLGYQEAATWKDHAVMEFERQIMTGQRRTADGQGYENVDDRERQLGLGVDFATRALADDRVRANLSADAVAAFERIRDLGSTETTVTPSRSGGPPQVHIPSPLTMQSNSAAREGFSRQMLNTDPNISTRVRDAFAGRLANERLDPTSRNISEAYMVDLRLQAQSTGSPEAKQAYNDTLQRWRQKISDRVQEAAQTAMARGENAQNIALAQQAMQTHADAELQRINNAGLTPLP